MNWLMLYPEDGPSRPVYLAWLAGFGLAADVIGPKDPVPQDPERYAGLLLTGGGDVDPGLYKAERHRRTHGVDTARDKLENELIDLFLAAARPIFGICRGQQVLNVHFGGKLIQHVPDWLGGGAGEVHSKKGSYDSMHGACWEASTRSGRAMAGVADVNSAHHQAIDPDHLGKGLVVAARSPAGIVEAVEGFDLAAPVVAVQWHPERLPREHPAATRLFDLLRGLA